MTKSKQIYLAGAIEAAPDKGTRWRTILTPELKELGFDVFNPCLETDGAILQELGWEKFKWEKIRTPEYRDQYFKIMQRIVEEDLKAVLASKCIVVYFDKYVSQGAGTYGEITLAADKNIPIYLVLAGEMSFETLPAWVVGCVGTPSNVFSNFRELIAHLKGG